MENLPSIDELEIEILQKQHKVGKFSCGEPEIDKHLAHHAKKNTAYGYGRTFVAIKPGHPRVWAYYTLAASYVKAECFPSADGCPQQISVVLLGRIGVESEMAGRGLGQMLMGHAFQMSLEAAQRVGVHAIVLDAKSEKLTEYYARFGFTRLIDSPLHMYLPLSVLLQA